MKRIIYFVCLASLVAVGCQKFDPSDLWSNIDSLDKRVTALEELCKKMNTNIEALQTLVNAEANKDYITGVAPIKNQDKVIGYVITFAKAEPITIYHGKDGADGQDGADGKDGQTPVIGVRKDVDEVYYWTLNGEWLLDESGQKIKAEGKDGADGQDGKPGQNGQDGQDGADGKPGQDGADGKDGITPQLKIEDGKWYVSYNNGSSWVEVGPATGPQGPQGPQGPAGVGGDSMFQSVTYDESNVYITLKDGTKLTVPRTPESPVEITLGKVYDVYAEFKGTVSKKSLDLRVKMYYGKSSDLTVYTNDGNAECTRFEGDSFTIILQGLESNTQYYYFYEVLYNGNVTYSEIMSFKTVGYDKNSESANCYIISDAGSYNFKAVKGNSTVSVGDVSSVEVLWETFGTEVAPSVGDLISSVSYKGGSVHFTTNSTFKEGNAVIAAKDASGKILWSWHIWFTDKPSDQVYNNEAGIVMDRNLGATSATPGDAGALGLLYQWGRKDPFLGSSSISSAYGAKSTLAGWPNIQSKRSTGTIEYATANPTTFITSDNGNYDWYYTGDHTTDNNRWTSDKTIYDPCPFGYKVPKGGDKGLWAKAFDTSLDITEDKFDDLNKGYHFGSYQAGKKLSNSVVVCWYPTAGYRYYNDGALGGVGHGGHYWSSTPNGYYVYIFNFNYVGTVRPAASMSQRSRGVPVRCVRE